MSCVIVHWEQPSITIQRCIVSKKDEKDEATSTMNAYSWSGIHGIIRWKMSKAHLLL